MSGTLHTYYLIIPVLFFAHALYGQEVKDYKDSMVVANEDYTVSFNKKTGTVSYLFSNGTYFKNTVAYIIDKELGPINTTEYNMHNCKIEEVNDEVGHGKIISFEHRDEKKDHALVQYFTFYTNKHIMLVGALARNDKAAVKSNFFSPLAILPGAHGKAYVAGSDPRIIDMPFDNDNWTKLLTVSWQDDVKRGTGYEFTAMYDNHNYTGIVVGNLMHNFWKTGILYSLHNTSGKIDSLIFYGGASTPDNKLLPNEYGGYDGTHDIVAHGSTNDKTVYAPLLFISVPDKVQTNFETYGKLNTVLSGTLSWKQNAPFYWNSFAVENVLGYRKIMLPAGVTKISDFLSSLKNFNANNPVLSIDSYDQSIYTTEVLSSISKYAAKRNQHMGFYFIPFAIWTWKSSVEKDKLQYTEEYIKNVTLKDNNNATIVYKNGDFGAFALDPTHPATRQRIIAELNKAKAIHAKFLKIDFLTAGALESSHYYQPHITSGMQAYNYGMKMLHHLIDSVLGKNVFVTQAISPMFPHQYAHARFLSTDIYSHIRNDIQDFPHYGSTASSMITSSHMGWVHQTLWPFTNMDVAVMKNFQKNPDISEKDVKVRLYSMIVMGSILGDGTDYRNSEAARRAAKFLNNPNVTHFFKNPRAFIPLKPSDGISEDQQMLFFLPGDTVLLSAFNFSEKGDYKINISRQTLGLQNYSFNIKDFLTNELIYEWNNNNKDLLLDIKPKDAVLYRMEVIKQ